MAAQMLTTITTSIRSTLLQGGLQPARDQWGVLNYTFSTEEWWPTVARAVRELFDDYAAQQQAESANNVNNIYINNSNSQTDLSQFSPTISRADQVIGVAEKGADISHTKQISL